MNRDGKSKKTIMVSLIILLLFGTVFGIIFASYNSNKAMIAENRKNNDEKIEKPTITGVESSKDKEVLQTEEDRNRKTSQPKDKDAHTKEVKNEDEKLNENKKAKITKEQAEKIVHGKVKKKEDILSYVNVAKVPYEHIETPYKKFPKEILNKEVYIFELSKLVDKENNESITVCRYYVDFSGGLYKDTYFINLECVKVK
ncbi:hypothetical protein [Clostridium lundense]|uniref:hypothetical protein n=1 Tax=Clostridium lundense TaxID=319475 RepID=UPI0004883A72|nr:hypothetical protein [Clostridium lundense]